MRLVSASVARSIPGLRKAQVAVPRKAARSVQLRDVASRKAAHLQIDSIPLALCRGISAMALPLAPAMRHRGRALLNCMVAYSVVFLSLVMVHIPLAVRLSPSGLTPAVAILWRDLIASHLGHLLLYGALIALMSYTEGLLDVVAADRWYGYGLIAVKVAFWASLVGGVGLRLCGDAIDSTTLLILGATMSAGLMVIGPLSRGSLARGESRQSKNVLIVGSTATATRVAEQLRRAHDSGRLVKGILSRYASDAPSVLGTVDDLAQVARAEFVDEVIVASGRDRELAERAVTEAVRNHLDVSVVPDLYMEYPTSVSLQSVGGMPLISVHQEASPWVGLLLKRIMDVAVSATALLLLLPWMLVMAAAIKLETRGPVLYTALRVGKKGRAFRCFKFRTMCADAERAKDMLRAHNQRQGPTFKIVNDPRITKVGRVFRRYSLDELPQLWNVLTGSMSLVGPRPHPIDDYQRYALEDRRRLDVAPGITGLWQVTARGDPSFSRNMALDLESIENWSLGMDLGIVWKTLPAVLSGTGT